MFFLSISCNSSRNIVKTDSGKFKLPKNAVKIEKTALNQSPKIAEKFKPHSDIYKVDDIYIGLTPVAEVKYEADRLKRLKDVFEYGQIGLDFPDNDNSSSIKKINKNEVFTKYISYGCRPNRKRGS